MTNIHDGDGAVEALSRDPTTDLLRAKAADCREQAKTFETPASREHLLQIALEYDRLAKRAEDFRSNKYSGEFAIRYWFAQI